MLSAWAYLQVVQLGRSGEPEHRVVFYFSCCSTIVGLGWLLATQVGVNQWAWPIDRTHETWAWLLCIGVCATAAQMAMTRAFSQGQALSMASLQYLGIVHAFVLGIWLFDEPLHVLSVVGAVLIVGAGIVANRMSSTIRD
jgi:S-adenosylmethionine uptake transporter